MNAQIATKLKNLRANKGLSQEQIADYLHVSQSTYARMESGESSSWVNYINPICEFYEIKPEELLKQDNLTFNQHNNKGSNNGLVINQLSEQLSNLYDENLHLKDEIIKDLRSRLAKYE